MRRLKTECEKAKIVLSAALSVEINADALADGEDFSLNLTRQKFNALNQGHFNKIIPVIEGCLKDGKLTKTEIHDIVLVGGSTRIPAVKELLGDFFKGKSLDQKMNPDEAVAAGAAMHAAMAGGDEEQKGGLSELVMIDITPITLGLELHEGHMGVLIPKNTSIPTSMTKQYTNSHDDQPSLSIKIIQGDKLTNGKIMAKDCVKISQFDLGGMAGHKKGQALVEVTFEVDSDGVLKVSAKDKKAPNNFQEL